MKCKIKDTTAGKILTGEGIKYEYNFFETKKFMKEFGGDWTKGEVKDLNRVYEDGSPKIVFSSDNKNAFYMDASNILLPVFNVKFQTLPSQQRSEISNGMVSQLVVDLFETKLEFGTKDIDEALNINFNIHSWVDQMFRTYSKLGVTKEIQDSFTHSLDDYVEMFIRKLGTLGLSYKVTDSVKQAASFQRNTKDKATSRVKFLLNTMVEEDVAFEWVGKGDNYLPKAVSQAKAWAVLLPVLSNIPNIEGVNPVDQQLTRLRKAQNGYPWIGSLIDILEEAKDNDLQTVVEFFSAFNNIKNRINVTEIASKGPAKSFKTLNVEDSNRDSRFISKEWMLNFKNKFQSKDTTQFKYLKNTVLPRVLSELDKVYRKTFTNNFEDRLTDTLEAIAPFLKEINVEDNEAFLSNALYFWKEETGQTHLSNSEALQGYVAELEKKITKTINSEWKDDLFDKHLREFAKAEESLRNDVGLHMATVGQNRVYLFSLPTMIQEKINELKSGFINIESLQEEFPWLKGSLFLNAWKNKTTLKKTYLGLKGVVQLEGRARNAQDGKNITKGDYMRVDFNNVMRVIAPPKGESYYSPIYSTQTPADKSREYQISTDVFMQVSNPKDAYSKVFKGYIVDELNEMINARETIKNALEVQGVTIEEVLIDPSQHTEAIAEAEKELVLGYHLGKNGKMFTKDGLFAGRAFTFGIIPEMNSLNFPIFKRGVLTIDKAESARKYYDSASVEELVTKALSSDIIKYKTNMESIKLGVIVVAGSLVSRNIDNTTFNHYKKQFPKKQNETIEEYADRLNNILALNYLTNSTMSKIEYAKIFTGSLQYYKNDSDYIKRVPATYIDGLQPMTGVREDDKYFSQVTFETEAFESTLAGDNNLPKHIQDYYKYVDRTDAQGYITIDRWKSIMEGIGKMGKEQRLVYNKIKKQWAEIEAGKKISEPLTAKDIKVISVQPLKGVYFENNFNEGPIYLKYSSAVLIPSLATTFPKMMEVSKWMKRQGVDELIAQTGVKVGSKKPIKLFEGDNFVAPNDFDATILDNRSWRLQQDLPTKGIKDTKIGVQIQKIILSRLAFLGDTDLGVGLTGKQMLEAIENTLSELSDKGIEKFMKSYGINDDFIVTDIERFYAPIIKDLESKDNVSDNLIEALRSRVSLAALPTHSSTVTASFMSGIKKASVDLMTPGGGFIQVSDQLIGKEALASSGARMLVDFDGLKPPRIIERNGRKVVAPGQVLIPHSLMVKFIPDYQNKSAEELKYLFSEEVRQAIGYRIPTQARASVDALEIVGVLPIELGDSVITYGEITAKTGSDFDIDKLFIMLPELQQDSTGKLTKVPEWETKTKVGKETYIDETEITSEQEVDVEGIQGIEKPTIVAQFLKTSELVEADNPLKAKEQNDEMKAKVKELEDLINCIWG